MTDMYHVIANSTENLADFEERMDIDHVIDNNKKS